MDLDEILVAENSGDGGRHFCSSGFLSEVEGFWEYYLLYSNQGGSKYITKNFKAMLFIFFQKIIILNVALHDFSISAI